jgi:hypothetical protein
MYVCSKGSPRSLISLSRTGPLLFHSISFSFIVMRLSGLRSRSTTFEKMVPPGIEPGTSASVARNSVHQNTDVANNNGI